MALTLDEPLDFMWYTDYNDNQVLFKYYGTKTKVSIPQTIEHKIVNTLECTTFYENTNIDTVMIGSNITKIY